MIWCCPIFGLFHIWFYTGAYFRFDWDLQIFMELHAYHHLRNSCRDDDPFIILLWFPRGASLGPSSQAHTFLHLVVIMFLILGYAFWFVGPIQLRTWMVRITHLVMENFVPSDFLTYHTSDAILGHISILVEICRSPLICMIIPIYEIHVKLMICFYFTMIP